MQRSRIRSLKEAFIEKLKKAIKDKSSVIDKLDEKKGNFEKEVAVSTLRLRACYGG